MNFISAVKLTTRSIVKVSGQDCYSFVQTLVTNDIRRLFDATSSSKCIYAHIINSSGRSLSDVLMYKPSSEPFEVSADRFLVLAPYHSHKFGLGGRQLDRLYLECPSALADGVKATFLSIRLRKNFVVEIMDNMRVWALYQSSNSPTVPIEEFTSDDVIIAKDPRLPGLGFRLVTSLGIETLTQLKEFLRIDSQDLEIKQANENDYAKRRYQLGVPEGPEEIIHGYSYPLECNIDYLNGLSFKKGLHSGDWFTARNWRKGIPRRFVSIEFDDSDQLSRVSPGSDLINLNDGEVIGEIRCRRSRFALASIRTDVFRDHNHVKVLEPRTQVTGSVKIPTFLERELLDQSTSKRFTSALVNSQLPFDCRLERFTGGRRR